MGCPDWPKCFGHWIPPTNVSQLPPDYQNIYRVQGHPIEQFNAWKTWTESLNRYVTGILGILLALQLLLAFRLRKTQASLFRLTLIPILLTVLVAGLGAFVVLTNLKTSLITAHMLLSLLILASQAFIVFRASNSQKIKASTSGLKPLLIGILLLTLIQIILGTEVRSRVDVLLKTFDEGARGNILPEVGRVFYNHGFFAWTILILNLFAAFRIWKDKEVYQAVKKIVWALLCLFLLEIGAGATLSLFALPVYIQPVHLLLATVIFGLQWLLVMKVSREHKN